MKFAELKPLFHCYRSVDVYCMLPSSVQRTFLSKTKIISFLKHFRVRRTYFVTGKKKKKASDRAIQNGLSGHVENPAVASRCQFN